MWNGIFAENDRERGNLVELEIGIEDILKKERIESDRVEFKRVGIRMIFTTASVHLPMTIIMKVGDIL